jgi:hypothetical protein
MYASRRRRAELVTNLVLAVAVLVAWWHVLLAGRATTRRFLATVELVPLEDRVTVLQLLGANSTAGGEQ